MKSIFVSAGHSNTDPGAVAFGRREADIAVAFRNMVVFYLDRHNELARAGGALAHPRTLRVGTDGTGTTNLPLRTAAASARGFDIAVEFHCNAAGAASATGTECLSAPKDTALAGRISNVIARALNIRDRGPKPENAGQHHRLAFVQAGGIIVELFFLTNPRDLSSYDARCWVAARDVAAVLIEEAHA